MYLIENLDRHRKRTSRWFFKSIINYLENEGEEVFITARKFGDVLQLLDIFNIQYTKVGSHGATLEQKLLKSTERVYKLSKIIAKEKPDIAVSKTFYRTS